MTMTTAAPCAQHCAHEVGTRRQAHGPYAPPTIVPRPVYRCCYCARLSDGRGETLTEADVHFRAGCGPRPAAGA